MRTYLTPWLLAGACLCPVPLLAANSAHSADIDGAPSGSVVLPGTGSAQNGELGHLSERLAALEKQLQNRGLLTLFNQISELKLEMARLRGQQDELLYRLKQAETRTKDLFGDLDAQVKALATQVKELPTAVPVQATTQVPTTEAPIFSPVVSSTSNPESEAKTYEEALKLFKDGNYPGSAKAFQTYLDLFPGGGLAANAYYWLGLSRFSLGDFKGAVEAQQQLQKSFPASHKVPDAMVSMARAYTQLGESENANATLARVIAEHPASRAAEIARKILDLSK